MQVSIIIIALYTGHTIFVIYGVNCIEHLVTMVCFSGIACYFFLLYICIIKLFVIVATTKKSLDAGVDGSGVACPSGSDESYRPNLETDARCLPDTASVPKAQPRRTAVTIRTWTSRFRSLKKLYNNLRPAEVGNSIRDYAY